MVKKYVTGMDEVRAVFGALVSEAAVRRIARALDRSGAEVQLFAGVLAPRGDEDQRHMADNISRRTQVRRDGRAVETVISAPGQEALRSEFGRAPGGQGQNADHPGHDAQPFFWPAYQAARDRARRRVAGALSAAAREAARARRR